MSITEKDREIINARIDGALAGLNRALAMNPDGETKLPEMINRVHREWCHLLAEYGREGAEIEAVYHGAVGLVLNMLSELMLCTIQADQPELRVNQGFAVLQEISGEWESAMVFAQSRPLVATAAEQAIVNRTHN